MNNLAETIPDIEKAYTRIKPYIHKTPLLHSSLLNEMLSSKIYFKMDAVQKTGSFKIRGVLNHLLVLREKGKMPKKLLLIVRGIMLLQCHMRLNYLESKQGFICQKMFRQ